MARSKYRDTCDMYHGQHPEVNAKDGEKFCHQVMASFDLKDMPDRAVDQYGQKLKLRICGQRH